MRVLVACEYSGVVRRAFRERGHEAYSCDLLPSDDDSPYHIQKDILDVISHNHLDDSGLGGIELMIAHPPCTYIANSGWHWTVRDTTLHRLTEAHLAVDFFQLLLNAPIPRICIENPIPGPLLKQVVGPPTQYIQPYYFGDDASKKTGLWLKGLPKLSIPPEDQWVKPRIVESNGKKYKRWSNQTDSGQNKLPPSKTRGHDRSRTYEGIARAFAEQWG